MGSRNLRVAYFAHSVRSDWNNGNAHFLRGLLRSLGVIGHEVIVFEPASGWSVENLKKEALGLSSLGDFTRAYPDLNVYAYGDEETEADWLDHLSGVDVVILHEWNPPALAGRLLQLRRQLGFRLLFHDTHHRASSSPAQIKLFQLESFDGVLAFGKALEDIYRKRFGLNRVWTLHEAADVTIFRPLTEPAVSDDVIWIGNWGDDERSAEIQKFLLNPLRELAGSRSSIYGVRYPETGLQALSDAHVHYGGYLPNLEAPRKYAKSKLTVHIPRQQYSSAMSGIPTIRVFEALACGIPLISAPWQDIEQLFRPGDFTFVSTGEEMQAAMRHLLGDRTAARAQAQRGLESVLTHHTCQHRAEQLTHICEDLLS